MNINEARPQFIEGMRYRFVMTIAPAMIAIGKYSTTWHLDIAKQLKLVAIVGDKERRRYGPINGQNFRAGNFIYKNAGFELFGESIDFPEYNPTSDELMSVITDGDIQFV